MRTNIFLGGACGTTTWRQQQAIPVLEAAGLSYFNPQLGVGEWTEECEAIEQQAKDEADLLLFVINGQTRGIASLAEAAYCIGLQRPLVFVLADVLPGTLLNGEPLSPAECRDLNRGRFYVRSMAEMHLIPVFDTVESALEHIIQLPIYPPTAHTSFATTASSGNRGVLSFQAFNTVSGMG